MVFIQIFLLALFEAVAVIASFMVIFASLVLLLPFFIAMRYQARLYNRGGR